MEDGLKGFCTSLVLLATLGANSAWADRGDQFLLGKLGFMSVDLNDADLLYSVGALYGYGVTPDITVEAEVNLGLLGGAYERKDGSGTVLESGNYRVSTLAGYGVYRLPVTDSVYLKAKLGLLYENVKRSSDLSQGGKTARDFGVAGGIGAGARVSDAFTLELEITGIDADILFYSAGLHYAFKGF